MEVIFLLEHKVGLVCAMDCLCDIYDRALIVENVLFALVIHNHVKKIALRV